MKNLSRNTRFASFVFLCCLFLLAISSSPAWAAADHVVTAKMEFSDAPGATCPVSTVVVSAASCTGGTIAAELEDELEDEGLDGPGTPICAFITNPSYLFWECVYSVPTGCVQTDIEVTVQPGDTCSESSVSGTAVKSSGRLGSFHFDI